jgi:hypothetical protein
LSPERHRPPNERGNAYVLPNGELRGRSPEPGLVAADASAALRQLDGQGVEDPILLAYHPIARMNPYQALLYSRAWHHGVAARLPANHLLDSQVQCVNALGQMVTDRDRIIEAFGDVLDIAEVRDFGVIDPNESGRYLTFEFVGVAECVDLPACWRGDCRHSCNEKDDPVTGLTPHGEPLVGDRCRSGAMPVPARSPAGRKRRSSAVTK